MEKRFREPVELVNVTGGLDDFAPEPERTILRLEPTGASIPRPQVSPNRTGTATTVRPVHPSRFGWARHTSRVALASSIFLAAAVAGILVFQPLSTPRVADPTEPLIHLPAPPPVADPPPVSPEAGWTAPSESPSVEAPVRSELIAAPDSNRRVAPSTRAADSEDRIPRVVAPSALLAGSATTPVPPPQGPVAIDAPGGARTTPAESAAAVAGSPSLSVPSAAATTLAPQPAAASPPGETIRSASADLPVDVARTRARDLDARAIEMVLGRYRNAFNTLDAGAAAAVWPTVNEKTLARAFQRLDDQQVSFESCEIEIGGVHAEAACSGTARYIPKVGSRTPKAEARRWTFILRRASDGWLIDGIDAR